MASLLDLNPLGAIVDLVKTGIDKAFPDPVEAAKAKVAIEQAAAQGQLDELRTRLSTIIAEATSSDPWTSRARPSFMYVMYIMLLSAIPMGVISAISPATAAAIAIGFKAWLTAIPDNLYALFGTGYVGYAIVRSVDKKNGAA